MEQSRVAPVLARLLTDRLVVSLGCVDETEAFGKAANVGAAGDFEHAGALIHTPYLGNLLRQFLQRESVICFAVARAEAGETLARHAPLAPPNRRGQAERRPPSGRDRHRARRGRPGAPPAAPGSALDRAVGSASMSKPTMVLLHGAGLDHTMWEPAAALLADRFTVLTPDLPGHGIRPPVRHGVLLAELAAGVVDEIPAGSHPVAFSVGALVAHHVAPHRPDLVATLSSVSSTRERTAEERASVPDRLRTAEADFMASAASLKRWYDGTDVATDRVPSTEATPRRTGPPVTSPSPRWTPHRQKPPEQARRSSHEVFAVRAHGALGRGGQSPPALREPLRAGPDGRGRGIRHRVDRRASLEMEYTISPSPSPSPSPMPLLAHLAAKTSTIRLGAGTVIAPFWHPIRAGECALLDVISNGRMEVGLARGAYQFEFDRLADGLPAADGGKHLRELVPAVRALWQGDYAHDGEIWRFPTSTSVPKPVQRPTPPMWIAARDPASHDFAVAQGCNVMVTPLMKGDEEVADLKRKFDTAVANHPEVPRPDLMVLRHTHVHSPDEPEGWRPAAEAINRFYRTFDAWFGNKTTPQNGFLAPSPESEFEGRPEFQPDALHKTAMIGTPAQVIERLAPMRNSASTSTASGSTTACRTRRSASPWSCSSRKSCRPSIEPELSGEAVAKDEPSARGTPVGDRAAACGRGHRRRKARLPCLRRFPRGSRRCRARPAAARMADSARRAGTARNTVDFSISSIKTHRIRAI
ncbi:LLM class flavin-dependent oxidoreductase [Streptomyces sp900129855]|uniref:LLM class flavin-dependent oxidoreductase n=1 Tax=Streptomyces sp. 900129855 TaxID=3155129 RepID=A0ABV2ZS86_9ACTN